MTRKLFMSRKRLSNDTHEARKDALMDADGGETEQHLMQQLENARQMNEAILHIKANLLTMRNHFGACVRVWSDMS
jgi:hypothetical protein